MFAPDETLASSVGSATAGPASVRGLSAALARVIEDMLAAARTDAQKAAALTARATAALMAADHVTGVVSARQAERTAASVFMARQRLPAVAAQAGAETAVRPRRAGPP